MDARRKTLEALKRLTLAGFYGDATEASTIDLHAEMPAGMLRIAAEDQPPFLPKKPGGGTPFSPEKRNIPKDHKYDPKALKPLARMLWAMSVSLGHALTAYRQFTRLKSATVSPDGLMGGRGYVMPVKDVRAKLYEACEALSAISDTIHDEINAPHWRPKLSELEKKDLDEVEKLLGEAEHNLDDPEGEAEEEMEEVEEQKAPKHKSERFEEEETASRIPSGDAGTPPSQGPHPGAADRPQLKQASALDPSAIRVLQRFFQANSSEPTQTLPGPRVQHLDRADQDQTGPYGSVNDEIVNENSPWANTEGVGNEYLYPSEWDNNTHESASVVPDAVTHPTPTEGYDFGIGYGEGNNAKGQGAGGYGVGNPYSGGKGVFGPASGLPHDPGGQMHGDPTNNTTPAVENHLTNRDKFGENVPFDPMGEDEATTLPGDDVEPVARSDYYPGPKGNTVSETGLPGDERMPEPGGTFDYDKDLPNAGFKVERGDQPYTKWDYTTHNMRPDYNYQRDPIQGPYAK